MMPIPVVLPKPRLPGTCLLFTALLWAAAQPLQANVFGDGDPLNGPEDDRSALQRDGDSSGLNPGWPMSAGTLFCDGKNRGSATLIAPASATASLGGAFIVTAAHVLYDLETQTLWAHCSFHLMGMGALAGYRAPVEARWVRSGQFEPGAERHLGAFGEHDWAFAWLPEIWPYAVESRLPPAGLPILPAAELARQGAEDIRFELLAWNPLAGGMSISRPCHVVASGSADIGGGQWPGQLLDDCDSGSGASGGGLVAVVDHRRYLIGVRSGSHWSPDRYPDGPPPGARWDVSSNTNFARAMDARLIGSLDALVADVRRYLMAAKSP